jgi:hypothetical protein
MFCICLLEWLLRARHSFSLHESILFAYACGWALFSGAVAYVCYLAIDPMVRRYYPDALVSMQAVLTGAKRDAQLGRDMLWGLGIGVLINLLSSLLSSGGKMYSTSGFTPRALAGLWLVDLRIGAWIALLAMSILVPISRFRRKRNMRFGTLGIIIAETALFCLQDMPAVPDPSAWYAQAALFGYAAIAAAIVYAARLSAKSRPEVEA